METLVARERQLDTIRLTIAIVIWLLGIDLVIFLVSNALPT